MSRWNPQSVQERFEDRFIPEPNSGCWLWTGELDAYGYGSFYLAKIKEGSRWRKVRAKAHRLSWSLHYSEPPSDLEVCHSCDVPACVNPEHLFLGTHQQNMHDRNRKGRMPSGEKSPQAKITADDVRAIRSSTETLAAAAVRYGIAFQTVSEIRRGLIWRSILQERA